MTAQVYLYPLTTVRRKHKKIVPHWFSFLLFLIIASISIFVSIVLFIDEGAGLRSIRMFIPYPNSIPNARCEKQEIVFGRIPILERTCH